VIAAFAAGLLFAIGLAVSGLAQPAVVLGYLDVGGDWSPQLLFAFVGAGVVYHPLYRWRRPRPLLSPRYQRPTARAIDRRLLAGAAIFGVGWGLAGLCPGPALVGLGAGSAASAAFVAAMLAGMAVNADRPDQGPRW
jgi:uncharacterized protein